MSRFRSLQYPVPKVQFFGVFSKVKKERRQQFAATLYLVLKLCSPTVSSAKNANANFDRSDRACSAKWTTLGCIYFGTQPMWRAPWPAPFNAKVLA